MLVIYNPTAGWRRRRRLEFVLRRLGELGCEITIRETTQRGDAEAFAREARVEHYDVVAVGGGDGTINEAANGLGVDAPALAVIPLGTANVLAAELGLAADLDAAATVIAHGRPHLIHLGAVNGRRFLIMAGIGFDAHVVAAVGPRLKKRLGKAAYVLMTLASLVRYRFRRYRVIVDDRPFDAASAVIANGHYYGGRFVCAPDARLETPELQVCLFMTPGPISALRYAAALVLGRLSRQPDVEMVSGRRIAVHDGHGEPVQSDGDIVAHLPIYVEADASRIAVLVPG